MGKGSGLAVLALLISIGGLGFGIYSYFIFNQAIAAPRSGINRTYMDQESTSYSHPSQDTYYEIPNLSVSYQVASGESVYFLFTCSVMLDNPDSATFYMQFRLKIDGAEISETLTQVGLISPSDLRYYYSVAIQYTNSTSTVGTHVVVVETLKTMIGGSISNCYLSVQTYIP